MDESEAIGESSKRNLKGRYETLSILIALIALSQGTQDIKAKAICELFVGKRLLKPTPVGIRASKVAVARANNRNSNSKEKRCSIDDQAKTAVLTREHIRQVIAIVVNLSLTLLPLFASDIAS